MPQYVRDKDGILGVMLIVEMCSYFESIGTTSLKELNKMVKDRERIEKYYLTVVSGEMKKPMELTGAITKDEKSNTVTVGDEGKDIVYTVTKNVNSNSGEVGDANVLVLNIHDNYMIYLTFNVLYLLFLFMFEIDKNGYIIPDFLTFPFVLFSILFLSFLLKIIPDGNLIFNIFSSSILISALGGIYGYAIGVLISSITYKKYPEGFGGGDIKLLSSLGVLFGINNLYKVIFISIISFVVLSYAFKQRYLPYASVLFLSFVIFVISNLLILK